MRTREGEPIQKSHSQFGLQAATRLHEAGIASNRGSACRGEYVPGPCTHRPSHHESLQHPKSVREPFWDPAAEGGADDWGEVVTRYPYRKVGMDHLLSMEQYPGPTGTGQGPGLAFLLRDTISLFVFCTLDLDNRIPRPTHKQHKAAGCFGRRPRRRMTVYRVVKKKRAHGGCLGTRSRRRTRRTAKRSGELYVSFDPEMSEWGNPPSVMGRRPAAEHIGAGR